MQESRSECERLPRTRVIATLGPASSSEARLREMIEAGMDVARINFSHADRKDLPDLCDRIRSLSRELKRPIGILGDLRGPRIRVGEVRDGAIELRKGAALRLTPEALMGDPGRVSITFPELADDLAPGQTILLDDGTIELETREIDAKGNIHCVVRTGGKLSSHRGLNLPGRRLSLPAVTSQDFEDANLAAELGFDFLALSFVQRASDVQGLKDHLQSQGRDMPVIAKIEKKSALDDIDEIVHVADGVMVARGDLALEMTIEEIPIAQKRIIQACRAAACPVITATQMLESMTTRHKPTRAEATDVANAILDGTDAVMLSGESAIGERPVQTVAMMNRIAQRTERAWADGELPRLPALPENPAIDASLGAATHRVARAVGAAAMVAYTTSGSTVRRIMSHRPLTPMLALSCSEQTRCRLALLWGARSRLVERVRGVSHMVEIALREAKQSGLVRSGDVITITAGTPFGVAGRTNLLKIETVP